MDFFKKNEKYTTIACYTIATAMAVVLLTLILQNLGAIGDFFSKYSAIFSPLVYAFIISFLCNPIMKVYETYVFQFGPAHPYLKKCRRGFSLALTIITFILIIGLMFLMIIPTIINSFSEFSSKVSDYITSAQSWVDNFIKESSVFFGKYEGLEDLLNATEISEDLQGMIGNISSIVSDIAVWAYHSADSIVTELKNMLIGFVVAMYVLASKEHLLAQVKKILYSLFNRRHYLNLIYFGRFTNKAFSGFIVGKVIDSFIIAVISFFAFLIGGISYSPLMALIIGITNVIPVFGPFIGGFIGGFLLLIIQPKKLILFIILVLLIQQLDGNVIGPKILGDTVGISSMWVLLSIVIFGALMGLPGMIIGVPIMAVIYAVISAMVKERLRKKNKPQETEFYRFDPPLNKIGKELPYIPRDVEIKEITPEDEPSDRLIEEEKITQVARKRFNKFLSSVLHGIKKFFLWLAKSIYFLILSLKNLIVKIYYFIKNRKEPEKQKFKFSLTVFRLSSDSLILFFKKLLF